MTDLPSINGPERYGQGRAVAVALGGVEGGPVARPVAADLAPQRVDLLDHVHPPRQPNRPQVVVLQQLVGQRGAALEDVLLQVERLAAAGQVVEQAAAAAVLDQVFDQVAVFGDHPLPVARPGHALVGVTLQGVVAVAHTGMITRKKSSRKGAKGLRRKENLLSYLP